LKLVIFVAPKCTKTNFVRVVPAGELTAFFQTPNW